MGFNQRILHVFKRNKSFTYAELDPSHVSSDNEYQDEDRLLNRLSVGDDSFEHAEKGETNCCHRHHSFVRCLGWLNGLFFCLSLYLFTAAMLNWKQVPGGRERNWALKQVSEKSPLLDAIEIPLSTWRLNGTFLEREDESIYRKPPSPEVDAAWARIETQNPIPLSRQDLVNQGKDPDMYAKFPESFGFGPDAFIGRIDVFHQIHCLNRLRMHLYWNVAYYYPDEQMGKYHQLHASHCVYALLQNLMCQGNVDTYGHYWVDMQENAVPDFNINHKCRDFEAILEYHDEIAVPLEKFGALRRPLNEPVRHMSHEAKEIFRWFDNHEDDGQDGMEIL
ncbi:putative tat pathway signal sequence protein [Botrytis cinerea BcDW1]|uniref:Putative tat pathway signal sequence protein n=1 Tax=Botryotinia fuckeliana (strain BcDW1) TaxID=1290391 RepID=M7UBI4_BOTF1|nr:putative tat pathway signal sequence protein [Botrytis cinerea BcDW1]